MKASAAYLFIFVISSLLSKGIYEMFGFFTELLPTGHAHQ